MAMTRRKLNEEIQKNHVIAMQNIDELRRKVASLTDTLSAVTALLNVQNIIEEKESCFVRRAIFSIPIPTTPTMNAGEITFGQLARLVIDGEMILGERTTHEHVGIHPSALVNPDVKPE